MFFTCITYTCFEILFIHLIYFTVIFHHLPSKPSNAQTTAFRFSESPITHRQTPTKVVDHPVLFSFFRNRTAIFPTQIDVRWHSANTEAHSTSALTPQGRRQRPTSCRCAVRLAPAWRGGGAVWAKSPMLLIQWVWARCGAEARCDGNGCSAQPSTAGCSTAQAQAQTSFICFNPHRPRTNKYIKNAEELILWSLIKFQYSWGETHFSILKFNKNHSWQPRETDEGFYTIQKAPQPSKRSPFWDWAQWLSELHTQYCGTGHEVKYSTQHKWNRVRTKHAKRNHPNQNAVKMAILSHYAWLEL